MKKFGLILDAKTLDDLKILSQKAEDAGFHSIWSTELYRTSFQQISVAANVTKNIKLGTAVALAFVRSPFITAITCLDLDELSKGRFILGLGSGAKRTNELWHNVEHANPVRKIKECITIIRNLFRSLHSGEDYVFKGEFYNINTKGYYRAYKPYRESIPIFMAGVGEHMTQASAEIADGYIGHVVCTRDYLSNVLLKRIKRGLSKSNRNRNEFTVSTIITCAISNNIREAIEAAKANIAFYATVRTYEMPFKLHGFEKNCKLIRDAYFNRDIPAMISHVSDEMVDVFSVCGTADECRKKILSYKDIVDLPILSAPHYFIEDEMVKKFQRSILETFGN